MPRTEVEDTGAQALVVLARQLGIAASAPHLKHQLGVTERALTGEELVRAGQALGLTATLLRRRRIASLERIGGPAILRLKDGRCVIYRRRRDGIAFIRDPRAQASRQMSVGEIAAQWSGDLILLKKPQEELARKLGARFGMNWFVAAIWQHRAALRHVVIASLFIQLFSIITPLLFQVVIDKVLVHKSLATLNVVIFAMIVVSVFDAALQYLRGFVVAHTSSRIDVKIGSDLVARLFSLPLSYFETRPIGQTIARVRELESIRAFLTGPALTSGIDTVFTLSLLSVMLLYSGLLTLVMVVMIAIHLGVVLAIRPVLRQQVRERFYFGALSQQFLVESVSGMSTIKSAAVEPRTHREWENRLASYVRSSFAVTTTGQLGGVMIGWLGKLTTALILLFGARAVIAGDLTVGGLIAFNMIANQTLAPVLRLSNFWQEYQQVQISVEKLSDVFEAEPEAQSGTVPRTSDIGGDIVLANVSFRHAPDARDVVRNVDLTIARGEVIGIVGPSGSGKSTTAKLLQRLYLPTEGKLTIDGIDVAEVNPSWLRRQIGVVLQENLLFNRSVHDNIALTAPHLSRAEVVRLAQLAGADDFIRAMPQGYDTMIEERGTNLSGGQRQRLAIARALGNDPRILIFDEATSALDYESERAIQANMARIVEGRTVIIIAHRLAAVRDCDRIVGMVDGAIVEEGDHAGLLARPGSLYGHLWQLQSSPLLRPVTELGAA